MLLFRVRNYYSIDDAEVLFFRRGNAEYYISKCDYPDRLILDEIETEDEPMED